MEVGLGKWLGGACREGMKWGWRLRMVDARWQRNGR